MKPAQVRSTVPVDCTIERHDANQLELRLAYHPAHGHGDHDYAIELFMFMPRSLGVDPRSYPARTFYNDTAGFLRLKTPVASLEELGRGGRWHTRIFEAETDTLAQHRLKLLGCVYRSALRRSGRALEQTITEARGRAAEAQVRIEVANYLTSCRAALETLWELETQLEAKAASGALRATWRAVDEFISLYAERTTTNLIAALDRHASRDEVGSCRESRKSLAELAVANFRRRKLRGYRTTVQSNALNESLPYRSRLLKRTLSSALYLEPRDQTVGRVTYDIVAMAAAAPAMLFAVLIAMWAQMRLSSFSNTFIIVMVASYMLKDRIKDWVKSLLGKRVSRWMPDRQFQVFMPGAQKRIAVCRDVVRYQLFEKLPKEIRSLRFVDHPSPVASAGRPEVVLQYCRDVRVTSAELEGALDGAEGLLDVLRLDLSHLRTRMVGPDEVYTHVHPSTLQLVDVQCCRVYHLNLVLRVSYRDRGRMVRELARIRVILDQGGILRTEHVPVAPGAQLDVVCA